jgi:uncharacterized protein
LALASETRRGSCRIAPRTRAGRVCAPASIACVAEHVDIRVRLTPRAASERIAPGPDGAYAVRVTVAPVDGRANEALCRLIADRAGVARSRVSVVRGAKARNKVVRVEGIEAADLRARLLVG